MARPEELLSGNCYFHVGYLDKKLILPSIQTLVYRYYEKSDEGELWIFEEGCVDAPPPEFEDMNDQSELLAFDEDSLCQIIDMHGLFLVLREVAEFHPLHTSETASFAIGINEDVRSSLRQHIDGFLSEGKKDALTITIRFTNDGLSLGRRSEGGFEICFFLHPKIKPEEEPRVRELFHKFGGTPHKDYLADNGRTRILDFAIPEDAEFITELCSKIFTEIYSMRNTDTLKFTYLPSSRLEDM